MPPAPDHSRYAVTALCPPPCAGEQPDSEDEAISSLGSGPNAGAAASDDVIDVDEADVDEADQEEEAATDSDDTQRRRRQRRKHCQRPPQRCACGSLGTDRGHAAGVPGAATVSVTNAVAGLVRTPLGSRGVIDHVVQATNRRGVVQRFWDVFSAVRVQKGR